MTFPLINGCSLHPQWLVVSKTCMYMYVCNKCMYLKLLIQECLHKMCAASIKYKKYAKIPIGKYAQ